MGRLYTNQFENVTVTAAQDLFTLDAGTDKPIMIHAIYLSQSSEVGDAQEEQLRIQVSRGHTTPGTGGTAPAPIPVDENDPAASYTTRVNDATTLASAGTAVVLHSETMNVRAGWAFLPTPEMMHHTSGALLYVVRLLAAPADAISLTGTIYVEEI